MMDNLLEQKLTMAVLNRNKDEVLAAIAQGATPTSSLFHHAFDERAYDIALALSKHIIFTEENKVVIEIVKNVSTDFSRSAVCFEILENIVLNNTDLVSLVQKDLFFSKSSRAFREICKTIELNLKLSNLAPKPETKSKIKI